MINRLGQNLILVAYRSKKTTNNKQTTTLNNEWKFIALNIQRLKSQFCSLISNLRFTLTLLLLLLSLNYPELNLARSCLPLYRWQKVKQTRQVIFSVGPKLKIPKEQILLFCGTDNFEQSRFQSIKVPIPKLEVPPDLQS